jgi:hypothetical protein
MRRLNLEMVGYRVLVDYCGEGRTTAKRYSGIIESLKSNAKGILATVKLDDDAGYRAFYLDDAAKCDIVELVKGK